MSGSSSIVRSSAVSATISAPYIRSQILGGILSKHSGVKISALSLTKKLTRGLSAGAWLLLLTAIFSLMACDSARAQQEPEKGGHEVQFWTGGGSSHSGGVGGIGVWNAGVRYGWI